MNKGLTGAIKLTMIFVVLLVSLFFIYNFIRPTTASEVLPAIWTADPNGENKTDFSPEETVYIEGENFLADTLVTISVTRPDGVIDTGTETTDPYGAFEYEYVLDGITGTYDIFANDGINTATISFTDSSGAIWTTKNDCGDEQQDINHYNVGDHVYINGAGFNKDIKSWSIKGTPGSCDSNIVVASGNVNINSSGAFCFDSYTVQEGDCGVYQVKVDTKGDNYQVGDWCDKQTTEKKCEDSDCLWCQQCKYDVSTTKTNQWLTGSCVIPGTDCGWHCEKNYCGATCSNGLDCSCPKDKCVGNDYYDYPANGTCKDCTTSCYCENGTSSGKPCYPSIIKNDPRCLCGNGVIDPGEECEIGNKETKQCGTDVGICEFGEKERECTQNCKWGNWSECKDGINPQPEICDGLDNDCGGHVDEGCCPSYSCLTPDELGDTQQESIKHGYGVNDDLQKLLDSYGYAINATEDQTNDQIWHIDADTVNIQIEFVGKGAADNSNVFGYYLNGNASNFTPLFQMGNHSVYHVPVFTHGQKINITIKNVQDIGFGINSENKNQTQRYLYLTQNSLNPDSKDHAVVFDLCNNTYMIGFEDLYNLGDSDYEDLVVVVRVINCTSGPVCGDSIVNPPEECELPNTNDNPFCIQTTTECLGKKLGQRDAHGNCDSICGCIDDPFKHSCVLGQCGAECDDNTDCQNKCVGDTLYYAGNCLDSCDCSWVTEDCNLKDGWYDTGKTQWLPVGECADKEQKEQEYRDYTCKDAACDYKVTNYQWADTGKIKNKELSTPCEADGDKCTIDHCDGDGSCTLLDNVDCSDLDDQCQEGVCNPSDGQCYPDYSKYPWSTHCEADGDLCTIDHCDGDGSCETFDNVYVPPAEECKSFYCDPKDGQVKEDYTDFPLSTPCLSDDVCKINHCDGLGSCVFWKDVPIPSKPIKTIGDPKTKCLEGEWCEWRITILTPITLTCEEGKIYWRYALDGEWNDWNNDGSSVTIYFPEESNHTLEAYCLNDCDESDYDIEKFKVEGTAFEIPLYKKWNLISVPFALTNDSISEVFKNISDKIVSVWTYDNGNWYVWIPGVGGTLTSIKPGWGYWVIAKEDTELLISGSLFSPITTPPSKELQDGWNLIGYYGTEWQTYELEEDNVCGYINPIYGNYVYCSLNSLIDTQRGFPRWSSLWGYDNCGEDVAYWHQLESCADEHWNDNRMYAGKGYWIEMDVKDSYAPATNCIWNEDLRCSFPTI